MSEDLIAAGPVPLDPAPLDRRAFTPCAELIAVLSGPPGCRLGYPAPAHCPTCADYLAGFSATERTRCEVWTRVMGYHRPVSQFNAGKQAEHHDRVPFQEPAPPSNPAAPCYPFTVGERDD